MSLLFSVLSQKQVDFNIIYVYVSLSGDTCDKTF